MTEEEERKQQEFDRKADKAAGCVFDGCLIGAMTSLPAVLAVLVSGKVVLELTD